MLYVREIVKQRYTVFVIPTLEDSLINTQQGKKKRLAAVGTTYLKIKKNLNLSRTSASSKGKFYNE